MPSLYWYSWRVTPEAESGASHDSTTCALPTAAANVVGSAAVVARLLIVPVAVVSVVSVALSGA